MSELIDALNSKTNKSGELHLDSVLTFRLIHWVELAERNLKERDETIIDLLKLEKLERAND